MSPARKSAARFRTRAELLDFMLEVAAATTESLDLDRILVSVAELIRRVIPYELFAILLYSEKHNHLRIRYSVGHRPEVVQNLVIPLGEGITGLAAATRQAVIVDDVRNEPRYLNALDAVRSELAVPMIVRNRLVGVLDIQSTRVAAFTAYDRSVLRLIASRVGAAILNASLHRRLERQNRMLRILAQLSREFSSILDLDDLLQHIATAVNSLVKYDSFSVFLLEAGQNVLRHRFSVRHDQLLKLDCIEVGQGITGAAALLREPVRVHDTLADSRYIALHPDVRSEVAVPLITQDRVIGVMDLESSQVGFFTEDHVRMLSLLAPQTAIAVENARLYEQLAEREQRMQQNLGAARELQSVLLFGPAPAVSGLSIAVKVRPAQEISGDLYDFFEQEGETLIAFGDSSGKGAAAALYGAMVTGLLRSLMMRQRAPGLLIKAINEALLERRVQARYVSLLLMRWHPASRRFVMANAGSTPPLICRKDAILKLRIEGVPAGLLADCEYEETTFHAQPGDIILLYSDGIVDQEDARGEQYGRGPLYRLLEQNSRLGPQAILDAILADLDRFAEGVPQTDDQTLIVMKVE